MRHPQCAGCRPSRRGIAGRAQIDYPGGANAEDPLQKLKYDPLLHRGRVCPRKGKSQSGSIPAFLCRHGFLHLMSALLICLGIFVAICGSIFAYDICRAPEGFEDETGFRLG
jgi:hypothetical protein